VEREVAEAEESMLDDRDRVDNEREQRRRLDLPREAEVSTEDDSSTETLPAKEEEDAMVDKSYQRKTRLNEAS
jgi:hypothetical protein